MKKTVFGILLPFLSISVFACGNSSSEVSSGDSISEASSSLCEHSYQESITKEASLLEKGIKKYTCSRCGESYEEAFYDLDEFVFEDTSFMHDGNPHQIRIKGMLPYGLSVRYQNAVRTDLGEQEATAEILDENGELVVSKKARLSIVENKGFPNIYVDTSGEAIESKDVYVPMTLSTDNCDSSQVMEDVSGGIRLRGNGTLTYDKKAFRIKFNKKANMLGLNDGAKAKSWVLIADYADQSMMRNASAFYMGNSLFNYSDNYCSSYRHVNLYLNDSYHGVYLLAEQQQINENRVPIDEAADDYTENDIGYLLELDNYAKQEDYYFELGSTGDTLSPGVSMGKKLYSIKSDIYSDSQVSFIKNYLKNAYYAFIDLVNNKKSDILDENNSRTPSPYQSQYETLNSFIDVESLFKTYLLHEIMKNVDVGFSSFYLYVDFSEGATHPRLTFGAPWDFDWSSGNCNESPYKTATGEYNSKSFNHMNPWLYLLSRTDFFMERMKKYYDIFTKSGIYDGFYDQADYESLAFADEFARNYERWKTLGTVIPKYTPNDVKSFKTHRDAVVHLTNWISSRKTYLDSIYLTEE